MLIIISLAAASVALAYSGITKEDITSPSFFPGAGGKTSNVNVYLILFAAIAAPVAWAAAATYSIGLEKRELKILIAPLAITPIVIYFSGMSIPTLVFSAALVLSVFFASSSAFHDKEHYKKIDAGAVARKAAGKGIFILNAVLAFAVFFTLYSDPAYTQGAVDSMIKGISGLSIADMKNASQFALDQQKQASYAWIENIEASLKDAVDANMGSMTPDQQAACKRTIDGQLSEIDRRAKQEMDMRLDAGSAGVDTSYLNTLVTLLIEWYPLVMALTVFAFVEFLRSVLLAPLAGVYGWALWKAYGG